ncbi:glucose-6-phosphate isomerase [Haliovirga abyssi]|uniref:Glucose-6-phosphate isomerase n=1 Tax=Haliovirga abyssi TaxID=2996794 RepID=A0AAU9D677_9FUSO|nr:glucose-6-phosphate isomerase [Haliovirga abyssi]BDU51484.1 glucose-6-phosphate isomerase [Haliovirga abyssi]
MKKISLDYSNALEFVRENEIEFMGSQVNAAEELLNSKKGPGSDFLGWVDLPKTYNKEEFDRIKKAAEKIKSNSDVLLVIGIGGSYLGARAAIEALTDSFYNNMKKEDRKTPEIYFVGNNISSTYIKHLYNLIKNKDFAINIISKSGTTTEPAIAFRIFKELLEEKYGKENAKDRIFATTDAKKGALKELATAEGYETFVVPDDVGGRFSVLTAVGLLPIAAAGIDIEQLMAGAADAMEDYKAPFKENDCYKYAALRNILHRKGKLIEIMVDYEPSLHYIAEWWKQLNGESEGKDGKGIFPAAVDFTTDLHSMGQYIQDGNRILFETVLNIGKPVEELTIKETKDNLDGLNYLAGKSIDYVNKKAFQGTMLAHVDGGVPNLVINIPEINEYNLGYLFYFFEKACAISGYLLGVNPFDQPGVEAYKKNMFALLGKPGYEEEKEKLEKRL